MKSGSNPREKLRIRTYDNDRARINLELKQKNSGKTFKKSAIISEEIVNKLIDNKLDYSEEYPELLKKVYLLNKTRLLKPVVIVEYDRTPYICKLGNVRITLDRNISSSTKVHSFFDNDLPRRPVNPKKVHLLEVKFDEYIPDYIHKHIQVEGLEQTTYSKYYICRQYNI
ncbi:MAG: VTC domain-containing protein [Oscillospiraceae bacterium]|nr:VTC domain-containing protein [Oscillospiraceae bacterium]